LSELLQIKGMARGSYNYAGDATGSDEG